MVYRIEIETGNDAFEGENKAFEIARILKELANNIEAINQPRNGALYDINGNTVGKAVLVDDDRPAEPDDDYREFSRYKMN